jgi:hypothetical protein
MAGAVTGSTIDWETMAGRESWNLYWQGVWRAQKPLC